MSATHAVSIDDPIHGVIRADGLEKASRPAQLGTPDLSEKGDQIVIHR